MHMSTRQRTYYKSEFNKYMYEMKSNYFVIVKSRKDNVLN